MMVFFFFSSRRRHTRFDCDWSSDVCSSDLFASPKAILKGRIVAVALLLIYAFTSELYPDTTYVFWLVFAAALPWLLVRALKIGRASCREKCRSRWSPYHGEKK